VLKRGPRHKICRRLGVAVCGRPNCPVEKRPYPPGEHGRARRRETEYQVRLAEKQKLRAIYGVGERQFRKYYARAAKKVGITGVELLRILETRLDTTVLRLGFALSQRQARQLVSHGHVKVDGRRVDVPSAEVRVGQTLQLSDKAKKFIYVREAIEVTPEPPPYLSRDSSAGTGTLTRDPARDEMPLPVTVDERLIVEHMSG
jgi:small subunit ribosomal protein S4